MPCSRGLTASNSEWLLQMFERGIFRPTSPQYVLLSPLALSLANYLRDSSLKSPLKCSFLDSHSLHEGFLWARPRNVLPIGMFYLHQGRNQRLWHHLRCSCLGFWTWLIAIVWCTLLPVRSHAIWELSCGLCAPLCVQWPLPLGWCRKNTARGDIDIVSREIRRANMGSLVCLPPVGSSSSSSSSYSSSSSVYLFYCGQVAGQLLNSQGFC